jgi:PEP-CTERM motif
MASELHCLVQTMYTTLRRYSLPLMWILTATSVPVFADDLSFVPNSWTQVWANFGTSSYQVVDNTRGAAKFHIFCLDFNDEIAPPFDWQATIVPLNQTNVTNDAQFGGNYGHNITPIAGGTFAFTQDPNPSSSSLPFVKLNTTNDSAYTRYLEAAWLFSNIEKAPDAQTEIISQVAAWELFVEAKNQSGLQGQINGTGGQWTFTNYQKSADYHTTPGIQAGTPMSFELAVDEALNAAQTAIADNWATSKYFGTWDIVTADKAWVDSHGGIPAQEFLSYDAPVPEPAAVFLLGAVLVGLGIMIRRKLA